MYQLESKAGHQRGATLLIAVMLVFAVAVFGVIVTGSMSSSDVTDTAHQGASVEALYAAETGMERALKQYTSGVVTSAACTGLGGTDIPVAPGRTFTTTNSTKGFSGADLPQSQCRVQVIGTVAGTNASRRLQAILDRNLLAGANPGFNNPLSTGQPTGWSVSPAPPPASRWDFNGGPEAAVQPPIVTRCTRAAYAVKARSGGGSAAASASGTVGLAPNLAITPGQIITMRFNYRVILIGNSGANTCTSNTGVVPPGGAANFAQFWFNVTDSAANTYTSTVLAVGQTDPGAPLNTRTVTGPGCVPTTQQVNAATDYPTCASFYAAGTPTVKGQVTLTVGAGSTGLITTATYFIYMRHAGAAPNAREGWIDNIEFINSTGTRIARTAEWRDCDVTACP
jgi:hypothetical protein